MGSEQQKPRTINIVLRGVGGVGKTSLIDRFVKNSFGNVACTVTPAFDVKHITLRDENIRLCIWDTQGGQRFRSVDTQYTFANGFALVYDITDANSLEYLEHEKSEIKRKQTRPTEFILIGNKSDLHLRRQTTVAGDKADKWGIPVYETSAKDAQM